jgi:hypothetical protein
MGLKSRIKPYLIFGVVGAAIMLCMFGFMLVYRLQGFNLEAKRMQNTPPTIIVHAPSSGDSVPAGSILEASATAAGQKPIVRVELWIGGELFQMDAPGSAPAENTNSFRVSFDIEMTEGTHVLVFRAVDTAGQIGQSPSIFIVGEPRMGDEETALVITEEGLTLQDVAAGLGAEPGELQALNPNLGGGTLPGGSIITVPPPSAQGTGASPPPAAGGQPPASVIQPPPLPVTPATPALQPISVAALNIRDLMAIMLSNRPRAPSDLEVGFEDCVVYLQWKDNADNESHFNVWMQRLGGPPQLIATLGGSSSTGPAWYKFKSPSSGAYGFWVEAGNALGSQPSEIEWIFIADLSCKDEIASRLEIEALDMHVSGPYDRMYCYLSLEGTPEKRIPENDDPPEFIRIQNGLWNITDYWGEQNRLLIPMPYDEELTIEGKCQGWQGGTFIDTQKTFAVNIPKEQWDGRRLEIVTNDYVVGYKIQPHGPTQAQGAYHYTNPTLPVPEIISVTPGTDEDPAKKILAARNLTLEWKWEGDQEAINGFVVFVDGEEFRFTNKSQRQEQIFIGSPCAGFVEFEVAAFGPGGARSTPSMAHVYRQPDCEIYAEVKFVTIQTGYTSDCFGIYCWEYISTRTINDYSGPCDALSAYYTIWATSAVEMKESYWGGGIYLHFTCSTIYPFSMIGDEDTFYVPIDPLDPRLRFGTRFREWDFWWDDDIAVIGEEVSMSLADWPDYEEVFTYDIRNDEAWTLTTIRVRGYRTVDLYE